MTRIAVVGAGLAGSSLTHWLLKRSSEHQITLFDSRDPLTASTGPMLLCHPFPGRSLAPHPNLPEAMRATTELLDDWKAWAPNLIRETVMWRPLKGSNLKRLSQSHTDWWTPNGKHVDDNSWIDNPPTIEATTGEDIQRVPAFQTAYPTLKTGPAFAIDAEKLFPIVHDRLASKGLTIHRATVHRLQQHTNGWLLHTNAGVKEFDRVVLAMGRQTKQWFPHLQITLQGGSLLKATPTSSAQIESLSLNGLHIGQHSDGDWVFGSTRWSHQPPDSAIEREELGRRLQETLPKAPTFHKQSQRVWSGVRTIYGSDRLPLCGELPQHKNVFVLTALGSKGWLWGPWTARLLQQQVTTDEHPDGFETVHLMRANAEDGWYSPHIQNV